VNEARRDMEGFARTVEALGPYLEDLVFVCGWAHYLYTLVPGAAPLLFTPLTTQDADIAAPVRLRVCTKTIAQLLVAAGFEQRLSGDHVPPISEYALGEKESGFYVEFLAPLEGGEVKRGGRPDVTTTVGGVTAQKLRHLDILLMRPWKVTLRGDMGFPVSRPTTIRIPNPASYVVQKVLVLGKRHPPSQPKDVLYLHDTFAVFTDAMPRVREAWDAVRPSISRAHVRSFQTRARSLISGTNDLMRGATRIAADRPRPPTPDMLLAGLRRGFAAGFDVRPR